MNKYQSIYSLSGPPLISLYLDLCVLSPPPYWSIFLKQTGVASGLEGEYSRDSLRFKVIENKGGATHAI